MYFTGRGKDISSPTFQSIGVVEVRGVIINAEPVLKILGDYRRDKRIKAIVLRIDSPGGGVAPTQEIYREIIRTKSKKKIVASLGNVAASGGFYIAAAADQVMANPSTATGSIGVIMHYTNYEELFGKIGLKSVVIKSGEFKDIGSPTRDMTDKEREVLNRMIQRVHQQFVEDVSAARNLPVERVAALADGRIFTGDEALELGLVDKLGNFTDAVELAQKLSGVKGRTRLIYPKKKKPGFWDMLTQKSQLKMIPDLLEQPFGLQYLYSPRL